LTKRKHIQISFNEIRHIMNLAQVMALKKPVECEGEAKETMYVDVLANASIQNISSELDIEEEEERADITHPGQLDGPRMITFDGDQTLYSGKLDPSDRIAV
jgi:hypothetical protein